MDTDNLATSDQAPFGHFRLSSASSPTLNEVPMTKDVEKNAQEIPPSTFQHNGVQDSTVIDWDGPGDQDNPINWPNSRKWRSILIVAPLTFLTPFASSIFAPAVTQVMQELDVLNRDLGSFRISIYLLGYAFGPLALAPCSELYGRLIIYHTCSLLFIIMNLACALAANMPMLIIFRFFTGLVGSCPLTLGPGTVTDCFRQEERGRAMAVWTMPVLLGLCFGPAIGAYVSRALGWRWNFWLLIIMAGTFLIICLVLQRETYPRTLLEIKAKKARNSTGNPNIRPASQSAELREPLVSTSIVRPIKMLCLSPICLGLSLLTAVAYGTLYLLFTKVTEVFQAQYGIDTNVGLMYLGFGCGQFVGLFLFGLMSDAMLRRLAKEGEMKPEYRLLPMIPGGAMIPIGLLIYGWSAQYRVFWFVPIIGTFLIGFGMITVFTPASTYLIDAFPTYASSAIAANTVLRSIGRALLPLAGPRMYEQLGQGWGNTLLAGLSLLMMGMIFLALKYGELLRTHPRFQLML